MPSGLLLEQSQAEIVQSPPIAKTSAPLQQLPSRSCSTDRPRTTEDSPTKSLLQLTRQEQETVNLERKELLREINKKRHWKRECQSLRNRFESSQKELLYLKATAKENNPDPNQVSLQTASTLDSKATIGTIAQIHKDDPFHRRIIFYTANHIRHGWRGVKRFLSQPEIKTAATALVVGIIGMVTLMLIVV